MDPSRLQSVPLFAGLDKKQRQLVARLAEDVDVPAGKELAIEGRFAHEFFAIESGTAEVRHGDEPVAQLGPGDFFGEVALVQAGRRTASVVATSPMRLIVLSDSAFSSMRSQMPKVAELIRRAVDERAAAGPA